MFVLKYIFGNNYEWKLLKMHLKIVFISSVHFYNVYNVGQTYFV